MVRIQFWRKGALGSSVGRARTQRKMHLVLYRGEDKRLSHGSHYPWGAGSTPATATILQGRLMVGRQTHYLVIWVQLPAVHPRAIRALKIRESRERMDCLFFS